ncbi:hypothetical protein NW249_34260 [Streptomyces sp. OUCMDZ-4982]|nr:hypothetical protein [Streptomyces sp. OUCMDZ-4982]MCR8947153.1 hypothetical protein [Streptomyces sp. OUCMDZ-4982]
MSSEEYVIPDEVLAAFAGLFAKTAASSRADFVLVPPSPVGESRFPD